MKAAVLLLILVFPFVVFAQPSGNKNSNNTTNPITNPYDTNPYNPDQKNSNNFFDEESKYDKYLQDKKDKKIQATS